MPGEFEHWYAKLEGAHGKFVAAASERILENVILVLAEVFYYILLGKIKRSSVYGLLARLH